jgi:superoxide reductase
MQSQKGGIMELYICQSCGHVAFNAKPDICPSCGTYIFERNDSLFKESEEKSKEASVKHFPQITINKKCGYIPENDCIDIHVRIGATLHPMDEKHYIRFIDCYCDRTFIGRTLLTPQLNPAACFHVKTPGKPVTLVEHCTIHGYWMAEQKLTED